MQNTPASFRCIGQRRIDLIQLNIKPPQPTTTLREKMAKRISSKRLSGGVTSAEPVPDHHPNGSRATFVNPYGVPDKDPVKFAKAFLEKKFISVPLPAEEHLIPVVKPDWGVGQQGLRATWLGHASFLIQFPDMKEGRGVRVLTDPIFSDRASPVKFAGPKRYRVAPCELEELPIVDLICISHNHYDHLDLPTLKAIYVKQASSPPATFVALGVKSLLVSSGVPANCVFECDWWDEKTIEVNAVGHGIENMVVTCTPAQHNSGRGAFDQDKSLWCSWTFNHSNSQHNIFFAGDTGYRPAVGAEPSPIFRQIGQICGPFSLGLIPIGNYTPTHLMTPLHCSPSEAMEIHMDVGAQRSIAMHWGTRHAGMSRYYMDAMEPKREFLAKRETMLGRGVGDETFALCDIGATLVIEELCVADMQHEDIENKSTLELSQNTSTNVVATFVQQ